MHSQKALVTGASKGIGHAIAECLKKEGYEVVTPTRQELDLSDPASCAAYCSRISTETFDILINNAGINEVNSLENITDEEIDRTMNVNVISPLKLIRAVVPNMKKQGYGKIVNIGSIWGLVSKPGRTTYSIAKHGIHGLTQTMAVELAPNNILVNTVCPGFTLTELTRKNNTQEEIDAIARQIPMNRMADPEEQAKAVCFLTSEENTYITGQQLAVDGGFTTV